MRNPLSLELSSSVDPNHYLVNLLIIKVGEMLEILGGLAARFCNVRQFDNWLSLTFRTLIRNIS